MDWVDWLVIVSVSAAGAVLIYILGALLITKLRA